MPGGVLARPVSRPCERRTAHRSHTWIPDSTAASDYLCSGKRPGGESPSADVASLVVELAVMAA